MAVNTKIEWCDHTFNPWIGCTKVGPGCDHCYAEAQMDTRLKRVAWGAGMPRERTSVAYWNQPLQWNAKPFYQCSTCGWRTYTHAGDVTCEDGSHVYCCPNPHCAGLLDPCRRRVFCASLADVFDGDVDPQWRADLFALIRATPNLDWLLLTKRIGNAGRMIADAVGELPPDSQCGTGQHDHTPIAQWPWPNVWIGATVVNQAEADRDVPKLLALPAAVRFLSIEPMLGPVNLMAQEYLAAKLGSYPFKGIAYEHRTKLLHMLDWVIAGGESGTGARPAHPDWFRGLRDQCADAGVPFLFKQWGHWWPMSRTDGIHELPFGEYLPHADPPFGFIAKGKKSTGRLLDGAEHNQLPGAC